MIALRKLLITVVASMALYAGWALYSGFDSVVEGMRSVGWWGIATLLGLSLLNYGLRFLRWHWMLQSVSGVKLPLVRHGLIYCAGFALTATPGKLGEALRSYYLKPFGVKVADSLAALFVERLVDLIAVLIIGALALVRFEQYRWVGVVACGLILTAAALVRSPWLYRVLAQWQTHHPSTRFSGFIGHGLDTLHSSSRFLVWRLWLPAVLIGIVAWGFEAYGFVLVVKWLTSEEWVMLASGIYALSMVVGALSFLPGGLGGAEAVMAAMLLGLGVSMVDAATATIICRVVTLWFAVVIGVVILTWLQSRSPHKRVLPQELGEANGAQSFKQ